jgi:hypothetical protein
LRYWKSPNYAIPLCLKSSKAPAGEKNFQSFVCKFQPLKENIDGVPEKKRENRNNSQQFYVIIQNFLFFHITWIIMRIKRK